MNITHTEGVITYEQAHQLLKKNPFDSALYQRIQRALLQSGIQDIPELNCKLYSSKEALLGGFGASEHMAIAKEVKLQGVKDAAPLLETTFSAAHFHHIVALAGDYYGIYGEAIASGENEEEKKRRFLNAFASLEQAEGNQIRQLLLLIDREYTRDEPTDLPYHCYSSQPKKRAHKLEKIKEGTGELLIDNSDHFSQQAKETYFIGHGLAIEEAREARGDREKLKRAYAMEAFACHFLTDLFASGHLRNQRLDLELFILQIGFEPNIAKKLARVVTGAQHEKDGAEGLNVTNGRGDFWRAYGDGHFRAPKNEENRKKVVEAIQSSVDEIYAAFSYPDRQPRSSMNELIPFATEQNALPLYRVEVIKTAQHSDETEVASRSLDQPPDVKISRRLFLYKEAKRIEITGKVGLLHQALGHALAHVPQQYQSDFVDKSLRAFILTLITDLPVIPWPVRAACAQNSRLQAATWELIGLSSHLEIETMKREFWKKVEELVEGVQAIVEVNREILQKIGEVERGGNQIYFDNLAKELIKAVEEIKDRLYRVKNDQRFSEEQLKTIATRLFNAYHSIGRVFEGEAAQEFNLFEKYKRTLIEDKFSEKGALMGVTLWFRQLLNYQESIFSLYCVAELHRCAEVDVHQKLREFKEMVDRQVEENRELIREDLVYCSTSYIQSYIDRNRQVTVEEISEQRPRKRSRLA